MPCTHKKYHNNKPLFTLKEEGMVMEAARKDSMVSKASKDVGLR